MMQDLTKGRPFPTLLKFTLPVIGGNLFQLFYTLADTMIVGQTLGADALAAVGSTSIIVYFVLCFIQGITSGFGICLGQRCGAGDEKGMRQSIAVSFVLSVIFTVIVTILCALLSHPILRFMQTPESIYDMAYDYMFAVLLGTGATVFYNLISNILRALGDSRTPLYFLVFSSLLNIVLDFVFILPLGMGVAGAAWATVLSQLLSAIFCIAAGWRKFPVMHVCAADLRDFSHQAQSHLKVGFPMGFQMSVMCIGQLAMQAGVNALGADAVAGYTAATKIDQLSVLVDQAFGIAISSYVAQNFGAGRYDRIRQGVRASLLQTEAVSLAMCVFILLFRNSFVSLFVNHPTEVITGYNNGYLLSVAPFYLVLGLLNVYRSSIQSMGNAVVPFAACIIELVMRIFGTMGLSLLLGYIGICLATPLAWIGAVCLLIVVYYRLIGKLDPVKG
ncbi:MAG TPA: MATE family efflux transporter [Candidatus Eisenbergiella merdipullorum]|uniref:MATE family efflux transporter n=1 Tax=Candidatus Eisenbergiella merdipullorum TaxID=2838553 RepID=A0A9D2L2Q5_9FIRM|nr:MATE family efflux transporter [Candidatus Eisenbergiella merdipullorum]